MWLQIHMLSAKKLLASIDRQLLNLVYNLTAGIESLAGRTLGILIGQLRGHRLPNGR